MTHEIEWLTPLRYRLDRAASPIAFFFRDDDIGYDETALWPLLDLFAARGVPLDLAVIPALLTLSLVEETRSRCEASRGQLRIHQHGWRHANHETTGRKCEFGPSRDVSRQRDDLHKGRAALAAAFGAHVDPIFTPPWNRCAQCTAELIAEEGFRALSRDARARPLDTGALAEIPVSIDWQRWMRKQEGMPALDIGRMEPGGPPVGVMLHHAVMTAADRSRLAALLDLLSGHENAFCLTMMKGIEEGRIRAD